MATVTEEKIYTICPACEEKDKSCGHIQPGGSFGPWYCDSCGEGYRGKRLDEDGSFVLERTFEKKHDILVALGNPEGKILLFVKGMAFGPSGDPLVIDHERKRYFYEQHTCPTNFLRVETVVDMETMDDDPHGLFRYLGAIPYVDPDSIGLKETLARFAPQLKLLAQDNLLEKFNQEK